MYDIWLDDTTKLPNSSNTPLQFSAESPAPEAATPDIQLQRLTVLTSFFVG